jgi:hypothetical protein
MSAEVSEMTDSVNIIRPRILGLLLDVKTGWNSSSSDHETRNFE